MSQHPSRPPPRQAADDQAWQWDISQESFGPSLHFDYMPLEDYSDVPMDLGVPNLEPEPTVQTDNMPLEDFSDVPMDLGVPKLEQETAVQRPLSYDTYRHQQSTLKDESQPSGVHLLQDDTLGQGSDYSGRPDEAARVSSMMAERPLKKPRGGRGPTLDWDSQRPTIKRFYVDQDMTLDATMREMEKRGFKARQVLATPSLMSLILLIRASKRKYKDMFKEWGMEKILSSTHARFMKRKAQQRQNESNKRTGFIFRGKPVPEHKYERPPGVDVDDEFEIPAATPKGIEYGTPREAAEPIGQQAGDENARPIELTWNGLSVGDLTKLSKEAESLAEAGNDTGFLETATKSLEGLEALLSSTHATTRNAMVNFVSIAQRRQLYSEAQHHLNKSVNSHIERLGDSHPKTFVLLDKLGFLLLAQKKLSEAELVFMRYVDGVKRSHVLDAEGKYNWSRKAMTELFEIAAHDLDQLKVREIVEEWIHEVESLGTAYRSDVMAIKHRAAHVYLSFSSENDGSDDISQPKSLLRAAERYLDDNIAWTTPKSGEEDSRILCSFQLLIKIHLSNRAWDKLAATCAMAEKYTNETEEVDRTAIGSAFQVKMLCAASMIAMERLDDASRILLHLQNEIDNQPGFGPQSIESFECCIQRMVCFLKQDRWDLAKPSALEAQDKAILIFGAEDPVHARIKTCLETKEWRSGCPYCWTTESDGSHTLVAQCKTCDL